MEEGLRPICAAHRRSTTSNRWTRAAAAVRSRSRGARRRRRQLTDRSAQVSERSLELTAWRVPSRRLALSERLLRGKALRHHKKAPSGRFLRPQHCAARPWGSLVRVLLGFGGSCNKWRAQRCHHRRTHRRGRAGPPSVTSFQASIDWAALFFRRRRLSVRAPRSRRRVAAASRAMAAANRFAPARGLRRGRRRSGVGEDRVEHGVRARTGCGICLQRHRATA